MPDGVECKNCDYFKYKKYTNRYGSNWTCSDCQTLNNHVDQTCSHCSAPRCKGRGGK